MRRRSVLIAVLPGLAVLCAAAVVALHQIGPRRTPSGQPPLQSLTDPRLEILREAFNAHPESGSSTILAMLSPT